MRKHIHTLIVAALVGMVGISFVGCSKIKGLFAKEEPEEVSPWTPEEQARIAELREEASRRYAEAKAAAPAFNRDFALKTLVAERYDVDLDKIFPEGYAVEKLGTAEGAREEARARAVAEANRKFNDAYRDKIVQIADNEFPIYTPGDELTIKTKGGRTLQGKLTKIQRDSIFIDGMQIANSDLAAPQPHAFNEEEARKRRDHYLRMHFDIAKRDFAAERAKALYPGVLKEFGFVRESGTWVRLDDAIERNLKQELDRQEAEHNAKQDARLHHEITDAMRKEGLLDLKADMFATQPAGPQTGDGSDTETD